MVTPLWRHTGNGQIEIIPLIDSNENGNSIIISENKCVVTVIQTGPFSNFQTQTGDEISYAAQG